MQYLLKAPDHQMQAWKDTAKNRGMTFAQFVRTALEKESTSEQPATSRTRPTPSRTSKRSYEPDPR